MYIYKVQQVHKRETGLCSTRSYLTNLQAVATSIAEAVAPNDLQRQGVSPWKVAGKSLNEMEVYSWKSQALVGQSTTNRGL